MEISEASRGGVAWEAGRPVLIGGVCRDCGVGMFPLQPVCPVCMEEAVEAQPQPTQGELYSFTVLHVGAPRPRAFGYVDLPNGVRVFSRLGETDAVIGQAMSLAADAEGWWFTNGGAA